MLILTDKQLDEIEVLIRDRFALYLYQWISPDLVSPVTLDRLKKKGLIPEHTIRLPEEAYKMGILLELLGVDKLEGMSFDAVKKYIKTADITISPVNSLSINYAAKQAGEHIKGLGESIIVQTMRILGDEDSRALIGALEGRWDEARKAKDLDNVRNVISAGIDRGHTIGRMVTELGRNLSDGFDRDLSRIVRTELYNAMQFGQADYISLQKGADALVYKLPLPTACPDCKRLYLHADGSPIIFKLSTLRTASNVYKKRADWRATLLATHPYCRCILVSLPSDRWAVLPGGNLILRADAKPTLMSLKSAA